MLDELKEEAIVNKVGGRFKLSTLIQKRLVQLNQGSRPLVNMRTSDRMKVVLQEIAQDKIYLDASNQLRITGEMPATGSRWSSEPACHSSAQQTATITKPASNSAISMRLPRRCWCVSRLIDAPWGGSQAARR